MLIDLIVGDWFVSGVLKQPTSKGKIVIGTLKLILHYCFFFIKNMPPELNIIIFFKKLMCIELYPLTFLQFIY